MKNKLLNELNIAVCFKINFKTFPIKLLCAKYLYYLNNT